MDYNPTNPDILGVELMPRSDDTVVPSYRIDTPAKAAAMRIDSTVTQTLTGVAPTVIGDSATSRVLIEMLLAGQEVPTGLATAIFRPTSLNTRMAADDSGSTALPLWGVWFDTWRNGSGTPTGATEVSNAILDTNVFISGNGSQSNHVVNGTSGTSTSWVNPRFTLGSTLTGKRILAAELHFVAAISADIAGTDVAMLLHLNGIPSAPGDYSTADLWLPAARSLPLNSFPAAPSPREFVVSMGEIMPWSGTPANIGQPIVPSDLASVMTSGLVMQPKGTYASPHSPSLEAHWIVIYQVWLEVTYCDENRASAYATVAGAAGVANWPFGPIRTPAAGGTYAKVNGTDLTAVIRQPRYGDSKPTTVAADYTFSVPYLEDVRGQSPIGCFQYGDIALDLDGHVLALGAPTAGRVIPLEVDVSGVQSVDSQPYAIAYAWDVGHTVPTGTDRWVEQQISNATAITYEGIIAQVRVTDAATGNITFTLRQTSTTLATVVLTPDEARAFPADPVSGWRTVTLPFSASVTLATSTQYAIRALAANADEWTVPVLDTVLPNASGNTSGLGSYHGATDIPNFGASPASFFGVAHQEIPFLLYSQPDPVTGFTATAGSTSVGESGGDCSIDMMGRVSLAWTASAAAHFGYYEIQRTDPRTDWKTIAEITDEAATSFVDGEGRIGLESCYRIRVAATTGLFSAWSADQCATRGGFGSGLYLSANSWPEGSLAYKDTSDAGFADRVFSNPEGDEVVSRTMFGRDGAVAFIPSERRFDSFKRRLMLYDKTEPTTPGTEPADPLRGLSRAALPYVCVCDARGGRWFCNVKVGDLTIRRPGPFLWVDADFTENTREPYPVDVVS